MSDHCLLAQEIFNKFKTSKDKKGLMAIKLDMEQAFDSMEWPSLLQVLKTYKFPTSICKVIMECVMNVRFSIILNGKLSNWIKVRSGLRQGCPLSPYLFIMCFQLLSLAINQRGHQLGVCLTPRNQRITHLLFAYDVLIFSKAYSLAAHELKIIISDFCSWSGHNINASKSQILFGKMVKLHMKKHIKKELGFKEVKEMNYLGVKMALRRLRSFDFQQMIDTILERLNAWGCKQLSMVGKITLVKSSLLTLPSFLSTHSLIPKKILHQVDQYLWAS
ncbi:putative mitochondrial protein [Dendrobium catenatum]|uniref:Putative mitochondrial protein n=1 Tax=Dendrobium catenatum TaxID=906689 RepID=A0A2I0XA95_9ASPA|nr:putative mitochondrial protein [Dendrobium catenatum]